MALVGKHALMEQFLAEGTKYVFGNPGSTELAFMDGLQDYPQLQYVLGLHETVPLAMADGYARATHKPAVVNVHIAPGLARRGYRDEDIAKVVGGNWMRVFRDVWGG